tara:strand:+ start:3606 stop:3803 length:198 start_codon:yes stop_codon:yes gene_type:complete
MLDIGEPPYFTIIESHYSITIKSLRLSLLFWACVLIVGYRGVYFLFFLESSWLSCAWVFATFGSV